MSAMPQWILRLPEIVEQLRQLEIPVVDRAVIEGVFGVGRRQAIELLHRFGGFQSAQSLLVERGVLMCRLEALLAGEGFAVEQKRRQRLEDWLQAARQSRAASAVRIPVPPEAWSTRVTSLPEGIRLRPGRLEVDFAGAEELLGRLFALSQAAANDFEAFRHHVETTPPVTSR